MRTLVPRTLTEASTIKGQQQGMSIIGLPDQAIKEAGERIQAAIESCGYDIPKDKVIISLVVILVNLGQRSYNSRTTFPKYTDSILISSGQRMLSQRDKLAS